MDLLSHVVYMYIKLSVIIFIAEKMGGAFALSSLLFISKNGRVFAYSAVPY